MLTIKKVPTLVSNYQEDDEGSESLPHSGCGANCLGKCCLPGTFCLFLEKSQLVKILFFCSDQEQPKTAFLHNLLLGQWDDRMNRGLFRYDVTACDSKVVIGRHGFVVQLNEGRHLQKRPTEFRVDQVLQPFHESKFNFTKVGQEEVLFAFQESNDQKAHYCTTSSANYPSSTPNAVAINVSPIEYGHVLLIPRVLDLLPQRIDLESFLLALHMAKEAADPFFRLGYNSLGAFATINHLHFQAYYLALTLPVEKTLTRFITAITGVMVSELLDYPVRGLVFEGGDSLCALSDAVANSCIFLESSDGRRDLRNKTKAQHHSLSRWQKSFSLMCNFKFL